EPLGLGHAVLCAAPVVGDEPFAVLLADDLIDGEPPVMRQMTEAFREHQCSLLGVQNVPREDTRQYGIVSTDGNGSALRRVRAIVEKPAPDKAPSTLAVVGRYILTPRIFDHIRQVTPGAGGEIQLTDAIAALLAEESVLAYPFRGTRYDCGSKFGYLQATIAYGRKHPEVGKAFNEYLAGLKLGA
ncbi:MAG: UTP--glucose-1-phosphate uridylyltransferase, partial [Rhodocyclaceae bacterium]|nr:UTP--glucose-1-phosphate uridylyltransferase [Rhodocyclaceae bacterium]